MNKPESDTPYSLHWWLKMHGQSYSVAQWYKAEMRDVQNCMRYIKLTVWIENRVLHKVKSERQQLIEALVDSKKAIESMPNDVLGIAELSQGIVWYVRDDVLDQIKTALRDAGVNEEGS